MDIRVQTLLGHDAMAHWNANIIILRITLVFYGRLQY